MAGQISQPNVYLTFPGGLDFLMPVDTITILMERIASVIPLPGSTGDGLPRMFWVDLGLTNYSLILQGTFKDAQAGGPIDPFSVASSFNRAWKNDMFNITTNTDVSKL